MQIAIVEDQVKWRNEIKRCIKKNWSDKKISIDTFEDGEDVNYEKDYDVIFMDVEMKKVGGFEAAKRYRDKHKEAIIVFLTTHVELSRQGYMVNAFRYIDKGHMESEMQEALKAIENVQSRECTITFHVLNNTDVSIRIKDIIFIETEKRNVIVHTTEGDIVSNRKIDELAEELEEWGIFRCHKSYLVNLAKISSFDDIFIYFENGKKAMVSTRKVQELKERYLRQKFELANS